MPRNRRKRRPKPPSPVSLFSNEPDTTITRESEQCPCESGHCGKDAEGMYAPATWTVTYVNEEAYGDDDKELDFGVCNTCINIYAGRTKTGTKTIVRVARLQS